MPPFAYAAVGKGKGHRRGTAAEAYLNSPAGNKLTFHAIDGGQQDNC